MHNILIWWRSKINEQKKAFLLLVNIKMEFSLDQKRAQIRVSIRHFIRMQCVMFVAFVLFLATHYWPNNIFYTSVFIFLWQCSKTCSIVGKKISKRQIMIHIFMSFVYGYMQLSEKERKHEQKKKYDLNIVLLRVLLNAHLLWKFSIIQITL